MEIEIVGMVGVYVGVAVVALVTLLRTFVALTTTQAKIVVVAVSVVAAAVGMYLVGAAPLLTEPDTWIATAIMGLTAAKALYEIGVKKIPKLERK